MNKQKILIRGVNWIGDAVLTIPAIKAVRNAFPNAHISLLVKPWVAEIFSENPDIDEIIPYDGRFKGITGKFRLAKVLRGSCFDTAILLQNAFDAALITWLAKIPERVGYKRDCRGFLLTKGIPVPEVILGGFPRLGRGISQPVSQILLLARREQLLDLVGSTLQWLPESGSALKIQRCRAYVHVVVGAR